MSLLDALLDVVSMLVRVAVDVVRLPGKLLDGEDNLLENTSKGLDKIEKDLDD
jgi:hypothetical protein